MDSLGYVANTDDSDDEGRAVPDIASLSLNLVVPHICLVQPFLFLP